jgi:hypothetical protein
METTELIIIAVLVALALLPQLRRRRYGRRRRRAGGLARAWRGLVDALRFLGLARWKRSGGDPLTCGVYVLSNPAYPGMVKVGYTRRHVRRRIAELSSPTGVPLPFELEAFFPSSRPERDEASVHAALREHRVGPKEFFRVEPSTATACCRRVTGAKPVRR